MLLRPFAVGGKSLSGSIEWLERSPLKNGVYPAALK